MWGYVKLAGRDGNLVTLHDIDSSARRADDLRSLMGGIRARRVTRPRPDGHGRIDDSRYADSALPMIRGRLTGSTEAAVWAEWEAVAAALNDALDTDRTLAFRLGAAGDELQMAVRLVTLDGPSTSPQEPNVIRYQATLESEDYRAYAQALTTETGTVLSDTDGGDIMGADTFSASGGGDTFASSSGGTVVVEIGGNVPTPPIWRITGGCTDPVIRVPALDIAISLDVTLGGADYLDIDVAQRAVLLNGAGEHPEYIDYAASSNQWAELPADETLTAQLLASSFDTTARLDVIYRNAHR